jgi:hypothetical protein
METSIVKRERRDTKNNGTFNIHQFQFSKMGQFLGNSLDWIKQNKNLEFRKTHLK